MCLLPSWPVPGLSELPVIGPVLFKQDLLVYLSYLLVAATAFYLYRTRPGLFMRALGENPAGSRRGRRQCFRSAVFVRGHRRGFGRLGRSVSVAGPMLPAGWRI